MGSRISTNLEFIGLEVRNHVGWLEFDRPPVNAFPVQMVAEVGEALDLLLDTDDVRVIVLASAVDGYFSAGADLSVFVDVSRDDMERFLSLVHGIARQIRSSPKPMLAAIDGTAVGGGLEMTLHCDVRFAARNSRLGQPEINLNFVPPVGATQALARLMGRTKAIRFLYDGVMVSADDALALGIVDELVEPGGLRSTVQSYAETLCAKPPEALAGIRRAIIEGGGLSFDDGLEVEREIVLSLAATDNFAEGVAAFLEKRTPRWRRVAGDANGR